MEDFTSIIGFIVTAIIYIAVWAYKSKKKIVGALPLNTSSNNYERESINSVSDNMQEEINKLLNSEINKYSEQTEIVEELDSNSVENTPDKNKIQFDKDYKKEGSAYENVELEDNLILEDFDLRKAVIYSEIMERKYF